VKDQHGARNGLPRQHRQDVGQFDEGGHGWNIRWGCDKSAASAIRNHTFAQPTP
jgi:hypothetical protein